MILLCIVCDVTIYQEPIFLIRLCRQIKLKHHSASVEQF